MFLCNNKILAVLTILGFSFATYADVRGLKSFMTENY